MMSTLNWVNGVIFLAIGGICLFWTKDTANALGISFTHPSGLTDFRATYGGLCTALGGCFIAAAILEEFALPAAWLGAAVYAGLGLTRVAGLVFEAPRKPMMFYFLISEIIMTVACLVVPRLSAQMT